MKITLSQDEMEKALVDGLKAKYGPLMPTGVKMAVTVRSYEAIIEFTEVVEEEATI